MKTKYKAEDINWIPINKCPKCGRSWQITKNTKSKVNGKVYKYLKVEYFPEWISYDIMETCPNCNENKT